MATWLSRMSRMLPPNLSVPCQVIAEVFTHFRTHLLIAEANINGISKIGRPGIVIAGPEPVASKRSCD
jgi:hypothetical protein